MTEDQEERLRQQSNSKLKKRHEDLKTFMREQEAAYQEAIVELVLNSEDPTREQIWDLLQLKAGPRVIADALEQIVNEQESRTHRQSRRIRSDADTSENTVEF